MPIPPPPPPPPCLSGSARVPRGSVRADGAARRRAQGSRAPAAPRCRTRERARGADREDEVGELEPRRRERHVRACPGLSEALLRPGRLGGLALRSEAL